MPRSSALLAPLLAFWTSRTDATRLALIGLLALGLLNGCGDNGGPPTEPAAPTVTTVELQPADGSSGGTDPGTPLVLDAVGASLQLEARAQSSTGAVVPGKTFTFSSSSEAVATVSATGLVQAVGPGSATITARVDAVSASIHIEVQQHPRSVEVTPGEATLDALQDTLTLVATVRDRNGHAAPGAAISWRSSDEAIATVSAAGLVTAVAGGSVTITAAHGDISASAAIHVQQGVASVEVTPDEVELTALGATAQLGAVALDRNGHPVPGRTFVWASSDAAVATVGETGVVTAVSRGTADITATTGEVSGSATVRVNQLVASIVVTPATATVNVGQMVQLTAQALDAGSHPIEGVIFTWTSADNQVASVDMAGLVTGVAPGGPVTITAAGGGSSGMASVTVTQVPVASVTVEPPSGSVPVGQTLQLMAILRDADGNILTGREVSWSSSNTAIATVSGAGLVTGVAAGGPVTITATSEGVSGTSSITVTQVPVASVTVEPPTGSVHVAWTLQLTAVLRDADGNILTGRVVTWSSANTSIATVSGAGLVSGVAAGVPVTITATSEGVSGTSSITVTLAPVDSVEVSPASASVQVGGTRQLIATLRDANGNVLTGRAVSWSSSDGAVATVSQAGLVTGGAVGGPITITATSEGRSGTASVTVLPQEPDLLSCGSLVQGTISQGGQVDVYRFSGTTGHFINLTLATTAGFSSSLTYPVATLIAPSNTTVDAFGANPGNQRGYTLAESGIYVLRINANNFVTTGAYSLGLECIRPPSPDAIEIGYGDLVGGSLVAAEVDLYTFTGTSGHLINLTLATTAGFSSSLTFPLVCLIAPSDTIVECFGANPGNQRVYMLEETGTFVLRVNANNFVTSGSYSLGLESIRPPSPDAVPIEYGSLVSGSLAAAQVDLYTFTGAANELITLTLATTSGFSSSLTFPTACLIAPSNVVVECFGANPGNQRTHTLLETGTYLVRVNANNFVTTGSYALGLESIRPLSPGAVGISYGSVVGSSLTPAEVDLYFFTGQSGHFITVTLATTAGFTSSLTYPVVCLIAPSDEVVECFGANPGGQRNFTLAESGTYVLKVNANNFVTSGSYNLGLSLIAP
jgi:uncharacterized protein YjdB